MSSVQAQAETGLQPLPDLDDSLIQNCNKPRKICRQCRIAKLLGTLTPKVSTNGLEIRDWETPDNNAQLQMADVTLKPLFANYKLLGMKRMLCRMVFCM